MYGTKEMQINWSPLHSGRLKKSLFRGVCFMTVKTLGMEDVALQEKVLFKLQNGKKETKRHKRMKPKKYFVV